MCICYRNPNWHSLTTSVTLTYLSFFHKPPSLLIFRPLCFFSFFLSLVGARLELDVQHLSVLTSEMALLHPHPPRPPPSATSRRRHRSVRGTSIQQLVLSSPRSVCVFPRFVLPLSILLSMSCSLWLLSMYLFTVRCGYRVDVSFSNHNEQFIDSDGFKSIWRHLHVFSHATSKLLSFLLLRSLCMTSDCCRLLCRIVSPSQTVPSTSGGKSPDIGS
jgi:hypothetical protein